MSRCTKKNCPMVGVSADCDLKDCPYRTEADQSKDTIYREDAIEVASRECQEFRGIYSRIEEGINGLPSADTFEITKEALIEAIDNAETVGDVVENIINRPQGTYTNSEENVEWYATEATCNLCGEPWMGTRNFCPNCGARMRPKLQGTHFDSIIIDECAMKGADDE